MRGKECIAMILAGGQGNRLGELTKTLAKPAVPFGGKYRIIDFTLSNCSNSGIDTVGVLTQYRPLKLNAYIGTGQSWDLDRMNGGVYVLPPFEKGKKREWYKGTANAIFQNREFIEQHDPKYVIVLSGDHIYKMDYSAMLEYHKKKNADITIAVIDVPWEEASRFGIMNMNEDGKIYEFEEKPKTPKSNKASMGVYIFDWELLRKYLIEDDNDTKSSHDFGKNVIPKMLADNQNLYGYPFAGYWKDVGTIQSLWEANMDLLESPPIFDLYDPMWRIYGKIPMQPPHFVGRGASVRKSIVTEGSTVLGHVEHSVIFAGVHIGKGTEIKDSIIMPNVKIGDNTKLNNVIVAEGAIIGRNCEIGFGEMVPNIHEPDIYCSGITVIGENVVIPDSLNIGKNVMISNSMIINSILESGELVNKKEEAV